MSSLLSVVIVSHNSWPYVGACIRSLYDHAPATFPLEVVLVDNASSDATAERVQALFPAVKLVLSPTNDGYGVAVNRAMQQAAGDFLVFLNPDCEVTAESVDAMVSLLATSSQIGIVGPRLVLPTGQVQPSGRRFPSPSRVLLEVLRLHRLIPARWRADRFLGTYWDQCTTRKVDWVSGACHVLTREVWDNVGPLTEKTFCGFDDFEYCFRAANLGFETWLCADAVVLHHVGTSVRARWTSSQVDELAINNMFVLLEDLWPRWRVRLLALAEASAAASECVTGVIRPSNTEGPGGRASNLRRRARQLKLLLALATGRRHATHRCDPPKPATANLSP